MEDDLRQVDELIAVVTQFLADFGEDTEDGVVLKAILEKSISFLRTIRDICATAEGGAPSMVLARVVLESAIVLEYLKRTDLTSGLQRFREFEIAAAKTDLDYLRSHGIDVSDMHPEEVDRLFDENKEKFTRFNGEISRSWYPASVEEMLDKIFEAEDLEGVPTAASVYVQASRVVHMHAQDLMFYILPDAVRANRNVMNTSLAVTSASVGVIWICNLLAERKGDADTLGKLATILGKQPRTDSAAPGVVDRES